MKTPAILPKAEKCSTCRGHGEVWIGRDPWSQVYTCPLCRGSGIVAADENREIDLAALERTQLRAGVRHATLF